MNVAADAMWRPGAVVTVGCPVSISFEWPRAKVRVTPAVRPSRDRNPGGFEERAAPDSCLATWNFRLLRGERH